MQTDNTYREMLTRQMSIVTPEEQEKFKNATIAVIGCGGIGGAAIEMLARAGVGKLILADMDEFDISNLNRQLLSTFNEIGHSKSETGAKRVESINPFTEVEVHNTKVTQENIEDIIEDANIVIDAMDNVLTRVIISRACKKNRIPFIHGAIHGTLGQVSVFLSNSDKDYESMFNLPSVGKELNDKTIDELENVVTGTPPAIGPAPNIVGCFEAMEAFKIVTGIGRVIVAPKILTFDLLDLSSFRIENI